MARKPGIREVAEAAGVSVGTVSHFLNGRAVSNVRSARIEKAINELGFTSNMLARGMRTKRSSVIGLCVPNTTFANFSSLVDELDQKVSGASFEMMQVLSRHDPEQEMKRVQRLCDYRVRGILLVPSLHPARMLDFLAETGVPTVILNRVMPHEARFDQVGVDHRNQMREIGRELVRRGHRSILFVARFPSLDVTIQRIEGLKDAAAESKDKVHLEFLFCGDDASSYREELARRMQGDRRPTYAVLSNSRIAVWTIEAIRQPEATEWADIGLLTIDFPDWADVVEPRVSFIRQPNAEIASLAWRCLSERFDDPAATPKTILLNAPVEWRS